MPSGKRRTAIEQPSTDGFVAGAPKPFPVPPRRSSPECDSSGDEVFPEDSTPAVGTGDEVFPEDSTPAVGTEALTAEDSTPKDSTRTEAVGKWTTAPEGFILEQNVRVHDVYDVSACPTFPQPVHCGLCI